MDAPSTIVMQNIQDNYSGFMLEVEEGGYAEFSGEMVATELGNYRSVFNNYGTIE